MTNYLLFEFEVERAPDLPVWLVFCVALDLCSQVDRLEDAEACAAEFMSMVIRDDRKNGWVLTDRARPRRRISGQVEKRFWLGFRRDGTPMRGATEIPP